MNGKTLVAGLAMAALIGGLGSLAVLEGEAPERQPRAAEALARMGIHADAEGAALLRVDPPVPGTVIGADGVDTLAPWIPPGLLDEFRFPELQVEIQETGDHRAHQRRRHAAWRTRPKR